MKIKSFLNEQKVSFRQYFGSKNKIPFAFFEKAPDITQDFIDNEILKDENNKAHNQFLKININLERIFQLLVERCRKVLSVLNFFESRRETGFRENDMYELKDLLADITSTLVKASKNEIKVKKYIHKTIRQLLKINYCI